MLNKFVGISAKIVCLLLVLALAAGCDFIQGFCFSRVLPKREAERYLRELTEQ